jgi:hypothetical protein
MYGGRDSGFCFNYWRLSYRRKFIRTLLLFVLVVAASPLWLLNPILDNPFFRHQVLLFECAVVIFAFQLIYTYRKAQAAGQIKISPTA